MRNPGYLIKYFVQNNLILSFNMFQLEAHLIILDILSAVKCLIYIAHEQFHLIPNNLCYFSFSFLSVQWSSPLATEGHQDVGSELTWPFLI